MVKAAMRDANTGRCSEWHAQQHVEHWHQHIEIYTKTVKTHIEVDDDGRAVAVWFGPETEVRGSAHLLLALFGKA
jgi:type IV secretory pathway protease TraF